MACEGGQNLAGLSQYDCQDGFFEGGGPLPVRSLPRVAGAWLAAACPQLPTHAALHIA